MNGSAFVLSGMALPGDKDPLGIWATDGPAATPFAAGQAEDVMVWRVELPSSGFDARSLLGARTAAVSARVSALADVEARLAALEPTAPHYAMGETTGPEAALMATIQQLAMPAVAFGTDADAAERFRGIYAECQALLEQFRRLVEHYAWVVTTQGGIDVALTVVAWSGDYDTTWLDGVTEPQMQLHRDAVHLALASRDALLRLINVVGTGALTLALKASVPGGQILLLPAVYQYVRDVLEALEQFRIRE